jgi:hypothetical protein
MSNETSLTELETKAAVKRDRDELKVDALDNCCRWNKPACSLPIPIVLQVCKF